MICNTCNKAMNIFGARYEQKINQDGNRKFLKKPYYECDKCRYRKYIKTTYF